MSRESPGRVALVGAGPGDPGLLTLRGQRWLQRADIVFYDSLVDSRVLRAVRPGAELVPAGKSGAAADRDVEQHWINDRLVEAARAGKQVVRLKGGDPFVFGRGGEEAEVLAAAGIPFEVVPGVTSAVAVPAYAGIPVTHRGVASSFAVVTGHEAARPESRLDWGGLARVDVLVFLMARRRLTTVVAKLLEKGRRPDTPAACIHRGTTPAQRCVVATLETLAAAVEAAGIGTPSILIIGEVVALRERLAWIESRPLFGRRIVVTRPVAQAASFMERLEDLGAEALDGAAIEIAEPPSLAELDAALAELDAFDWVVFTSTNGVERFFSRMRHAELDVRRLGAAKLAAIGPATADALRDRGLRVDAMPEAYRAEGLAALLEGQVAGQRVLLARAEGARDVLPERLSAAGAEVVDVVSYRAVAPTDLAAETRAALEAGKVDAVTFTSSSTVRNFVDLAGGSVALAGATIACIGPITAATARDCGLHVDVEAAEFTTDGLLAALVDYFSTPAE